MHHSGLNSGRAVLLAVLAGLLACAHRISQVSDCDRAPNEQRIACTACTVQNNAGGLLGEYEYRPDNDPKDRCVRKN
ncbi:MAG TPA: hypothetical protein VN883_14450 [Myxococcales bacterium]|jgi:hypothetical protein|nr:hypothetical protein [Myxococcales bacterium]